MAEFTPQVQDPGNVWQIGRGAEAPDSLLGSLGKVIGDVADKGIDIFRQYKGNELQSSEGQELSQAVRDYANGPSLVGQQTNPAESDPGYQSAASEMSRHAQAAAQGTPGAKAALLTRLSEIQSRYAAQNPYYAPQLAEHAQKILGFNANTELFQAASNAEDFQRTLNQGAQKALIDKAVEAGAGHYNEDSSLDVQQTLLNGQQILMEEHKAKVATEQAQLAALQAKPQLTSEQVTDQEYRINKPAVLAIANSASNGAVSQLQSILTNLGKGTPADAAQLGALVGVAQAKAQAATEAYISSHNIGSGAATQLRSEVVTQFAPIKTILGNDLSHVKLITDALNSLKAQNGIAFHEAAPHAAAANDIGGPQASAALLQSFTGPATNNQTFEMLRKEYGSYFNPPATFDQAARGTNAIMDGQYPIASNPDKSSAKSSMTMALGVLDNFSARPHQLSDKEQRAFGNIVGNASQAAVQSNDPASLLNAANRLTSPGTVQGLVKWAGNPSNANDVPRTLSYYGQYLQRTQQEAAKALTSGGDVVLNTPDGRSTISVHYSGTVDSAGQAVPVFKAVQTTAGSRPGGTTKKDIQLTGAQQSQVMSQDPNFGRVIQTYNNTLRADQQVMKAFTPQQQAEGSPSTLQNGVFARELIDLFPGAKITSTTRTAAENARAHGSPNSMHLHGQAIDFDAPGYTKAQIRAALEERGLPVTELLDASDEKAQGVGSMGPHTFHWGWGPKKTAEAHVLHIQEG